MADEDFSLVEPGDDWAALDDLLGIEAAPAPMTPEMNESAFYGRCSTEDNQDPKTSRAWQFSNAQKFIEPFGGRIAIEFFDRGQSRSVPWDRREQARILLAQLKNPNRGWSSIVVGEGTRCWFGNQFSLIAPRLMEYGVDLWIPELGGKYDPRNASHKVLMSVLGGMSESERQHVQARVRAAMGQQVLLEGRFQGGVIPYGYRLIDAGLHPNPRKSSLGLQLHKLAIDPQAAHIVRRIFLACLGNEIDDGMGVTAIATMLNREGVPCPTQLRPRSTKERNATAWTKSSIQNILASPRYTGYAIFGKKIRYESLIDPDDVVAGYRVRFKDAEPENVIRSRQPAHPAIVTVNEFTRVTLVRRARGAGGMRGIASLERCSDTTRRVYLFRSRIRHDDCGRKMQACMGGSKHQHKYYRCRLGEDVSGAAPGNHPKSAYIAEAAISDGVNGWLATLFAPDKRDATIRALVGSQKGEEEPPAASAIRRRLADAETRLHRFRKAIADGVNASAVAQEINQAESDCNTARAELAYLMNTPKTVRLDAAEINAILDEVGDIPAVLDAAQPEHLAKLYADLGLQVRVRITPDGARHAAVSIGVASVQNGSPDRRPPGT